jgi:hypothetical protein
VRKIKKFPSLEGTGGGSIEKRKKLASFSLNRAEARDLVAWRGVAWRKVY